MSMDRLFELTNRLNELINKNASTFSSLRVWGYPPNGCPIGYLLCAIGGYTPVTIMAKATIVIVPYLRENNNLHSLEVSFPMLFPMLFKHIKDTPSYSGKKIGVYGLFNEGDQEWENRSDIFYPWRSDIFYPWDIWT